VTVTEITESDLMRDLDSTVRNIKSLKSLGLRIAVDDFGTGYSSFSYLEQLSIDILKVDRSFVANVANVKIDSGRASLTPAIVQLAHTLGLLPSPKASRSPNRCRHFAILTAICPGVSPRYAPQCRRDRRVATFPRLLGQHF
jgi:hypothetical protein